MAFFNNNAEKPEPSRQSLEQRFHSARRSILMVVIFTVVNIVLLVTNSSSYFIFSAFIPYFITGMGMMLCGYFPAEYYEGEFLEQGFLDPRVLTVAIAISVVIVMIYLACWMFSRNLKRGWLICAFILFALDTVIMFLLSDKLLSSILDILFHGWVLFDIGIAIHVAGKLSQLPEEDAVPAISDESHDSNDPQ